MNRRGIALLAAVAVLLTLGVIATTGVTLAIREADLGRAALADAKALGAAEAAVAEGFRGWNRGLTPVTTGDSVALPVRPLPGGILGSLTLHSLGGPILALRGLGQSIGPNGAILSRAHIELLIRLDSAVTDSFVYPRAITRGWRRIP